MALCSLVVPPAWVIRMACSSWPWSFVNFARMLALLPNSTTCATSSRRRVLVNRTAASWAKFILSTMLAEVSSRSTMRMGRSSRENASISCRMPSS